MEIRKCVLASLTVWALITTVGCRESSNSAQDSSGTQPVNNPSEVKASSDSQVVENPAGTAEKPEASPAPTAQTLSSNEPANTKIVIYGDTQKNHEVHKKIVGLMTEQSPRSVYHVGDLTEDGNNAENWKIFNDITANLREKVQNHFYPILGEREKNSDLYLKNFESQGTKHWYSITEDDILFVLIDSNLFINNKDKELQKQQFDWLDSTLKSRVANIKATIVLQHHPIYSSSNTEGENASLTKILEENKVSAVFSGHVNNYERSEANGVVYVVTGGGGATLEPAPLKLVKNRQNRKAYKETYEYCLLDNQPQEIRVTALDSNNKQVDVFTLPKAK